MDLEIVYLLRWTHSLPTLSRPVGRWSVWSLVLAPSGTTDPAAGLKGFQTGYGLALGIFDRPLSWRDLFAIYI